MSRYGNYPNPDLCKKYGCYRERNELAKDFIMGCEGCLLNEKEKQQNIESVSKEAKEYAVRNKTFVVVYLLADGKAAFMEAEAARSSGVIPVKFVSYLQQTSDG